MTVAASPTENIRQERDLMVVLPVLQGRNISGEKLQYVYTKAPVTMVISDTQTTTRRPATKSWPASFASKAQVFLVEPSVRRTFPYPGWVRNIIPTTQRPNYSEVFRLARFTAKPTNPPVLQFPSDNKYDISVSKVTWKKSTDKSPVKWVGAEDATSTQSTAAAEPTLDITTANFLQFNSSSTNSSISDNKTVVQLAWDLQASTNRLTNDIKSMLLHLGLLAQGPSPQGDSNELGSEGSETNNSDDSSSYMQYKEIPVRDEMAIRDDMRQLLDTFGLLPSKNETNSTDEATSRLKRETKEQEPVSLLDVHQLFSQTVNKSSRSGGRNRTSKSAPLKSGLENSTIKPLASFGQRRYRGSYQKQTRAVDTGASTKKVESKDSGPNSKGTASAEQLSGSFGGEQVDEQNSPPKPTNGLYFWVDYNKFFNLTGKPDVRLAYSSRAGDPTKFLPITDWRTKL